jgi:hypothetical protein
MYFAGEYTDMLDYFYSPTAKKSSDGSFTPRDIQIPPALPIPSSVKPGRVGMPYLHWFSNMRTEMNRSKS